MSRRIDHLYRLATTDEYMKSIAFEIFAGWRYLRAGKKQGFISLISLLSMIGITLGVMTLIVVIAVMTGAEYDFRARVLGSQPHIMLMRQGSMFKDNRNILQIIRSFPDVASANPFIHAQVVLRSSKGLAGALLKGVPPDIFRQVQLKTKSTSHSQSEDNAAPEILVGKSLAKELNIHTGDQVLYMMFPSGSRFSIGRLPRMQRFEVMGIFSTGLDEFDKSLVYIRLADAQALLGVGKSISGIEVQVREVEKTEAVSNSIKTRIGPEFWSMNWMQMNRNIFSALRLQKTVMFIILVLIVLVAAFNIAGSLFMMVIERTRDIAILKAMGANNGSIRRIFLFKGLVIGLIGILLGMIGGFALCAILAEYHFIELPGDVYYFTTLPVRLETLDVVVICVTAWIICFFASLYPAYLAAKMTPVEGLRSI